MQAGIFTLSVRIGAQQVFWACISLLELAYAGAVAFGLTSPVRILPMRIPDLCRHPVHSSGLTVLRTTAIAMQHFAQVQWSQVATVVAHLFMGALLFVRARATDLTSSKSIYSCYM
jgi:homogentisate phytyltransferase / homogentisate geranylgeranyltransferase